MPDVKLDFDFVDYAFNMALGLYIRDIVVEGKKVQMVSRDRVTWFARALSHFVNLEIKTDKKMLTAAESRYEHELKMLPTQVRPKRIQGGNYHPPKMQQTLRKKHAVIEQKAALLNNARNENNRCKALPKNQGPLYGGAKRIKKG